MNWRYQIISESTDGGPVSFSLCEVYLDEQGRLERWTAGNMSPAGDDAAELRRDVIHMLIEPTRYKPVAGTDLKVGMEFEGALSAYENAELVRLTESFAENRD